MTRSTSSLLYLGSTGATRLIALRRLAMSYSLLSGSGGSRGGLLSRGAGGALLLMLHAIFGTAAVAARNAEAVEHATDDVVTDARQILDTAATNEHDAVLLQIVSLARNVGRDFVTRRETDTGNFPQRG